MAKLTGWASIIRSVQTPLGFSALVVLVIESILGGLAVRAKGADFTILLVGMLATVLLLVVAVFWTASRSVATSASTTKMPPPAVGMRSSPPSTRKYDVFLSSVLAGFADDSRLLKEKELALAVSRCLEQECGFTVYYAGRDVQSSHDFDGSHIGAKRDIDALRDSRYFLMLYPERVTSSVLFEAGFALSHCDASIYFVKSAQDLPYLMRRLPEAFAQVKTFTYQDAEGILKVVKLHRQDLFKDIASKP